MNFKRILVLVMTFAVLIGTFAPTLGVFAEEINEGTNIQEKPDKNYVSIGDSMTNGYGFEGYNQGENMTLENFIAGNGVYGEGSYALQFEKYLSQFYTVDHTKLAASALRAEDLLYLLGGRDEYADDWFEEVLYYSTGHHEHFDLIGELAAHYQNAVKDADIITLGIGNASFGAFMLSRITSALGVMGGSLDPEQIEMYKLENALALLENEDDKAKLLELYDKFCKELNKYVPADIAEQYNLDIVCDIFAYITANFMFNYAKSIDKIVELNEKENLEIILVGLMNTTYGMVITLDEENSIPFGDIMDEMFGLLNSYIAAYPTVKQAAGEFEGVTFYYAEQPNPDFIVNAFDDLAANNWENVDYGRLSAEIVRSRTITTFNDTLRPMIALGFIAGVNAGIEANVELGVLDYFRGEFGVNPDMMPDAEFKQFVYDSGYGEAFEAAFAENMVGRLLPDDYNILPAITLADVEAYEANTPNAWNNEYFFMDTTDCHNLSIAVYLAIEEAIVQSVAVDDIPLNGLQAIAGDLMSVFDGFTPDTTSPVAVYNDLVSFFTTDDLLPLVKIYAIFQIGNGMSVHPTPTGHDNLYKAIVEVYETKWTVQKQTLKNVYEYVLEYYDEAYLYGYGYANENGYIDISVNAIERAIEALNVAIEEVNGGLLGTTDELRAELVKELYATIETLKELREVLASDSAKDVEGLVAAVFALEDDLYTHLNNIGAICAQAGLDIYELVLVPALNEALRILNEEVIPAAKAAAEAFANAVVEYVQAKLEALYSELLGITREVYNQIIETLVRIQLHVQNKIENALAPIVNAYFTLVQTLTEIYGTVEEAVRVAGCVYAQLVELNEKLNGALTEAMDKVADFFVTLYEAYGNVEDALRALNEVLMNIVKTVDGTVESVIEAYHALVAKLYEIYGTVEEALNKAYEIYTNIVNTVDYAVEKALNLYNTILNVLVNTYGNVKNVVIVASQIFSYVYDFVAENLTPAQLEEIFNNVVEIVKEAYGVSQDVYYVATQVYAYIANTVEHAFEGNYQLNANSMYVSLGNAVYGEELAGMLNLEDKYFNFALNGNYLEKVAEADLITIRLDNGEAFAFAMAQVQNPTKLDWDKYLDAEGQAALNEALAEVKAELILSGKASELVDAAEAVLGVPGMTITDDFVANVVAYAIEGTLYAYAEFIERLTVVLENVYEAAPEAAVVLTGIQNPLAGLDLNDLGLDVNLGEYAKAVDFVVAGLNVNLVAAALVRENTIFVDSVDAEEIYDALNVTCAHAYDDCSDTTCNICGETRVAPGHSFTKYVYNNDAKCELDGTETATCDYCDAKDTKTANGTALAHEWEEATCTSPKTCKLCGGKDGAALGHSYGEWTILREPTHKVEGFKERVCERCGRIDALAIPVLEGMSTGAIVAISVGSVVAAAGAGAAVYFFIIKKKKIAPTPTKK